jgi:hypothetical protein
MSNALAQLDKARQMLAESRTLPEVKKIRDIAEAAKVYAKAAHLSKESQMYAAEIALLATHKAGQILSRLEKSEGGRPSKTVAAAATVSEYSKVLQDSDTPIRTAAAWQQIGKIPATTVDAYVNQAKETHQDISQNALLKFSMREQKAKNPQPVQPKPVPAFEAQDFTAKITAFRTELGTLNAHWLRTQTPKDNEDLITLVASLRTMAKEATERADRIELAIQTLTPAEVA